MYASSLAQSQPEVNNFNLILHLLGVPPSEASAKLPGITTSSQFFDDAYFSTLQKANNIPEEIRQLRQAIIKEEGWAKLPQVSSFFWQKVLFDTEEEDEKKDAISRNDEHQQDDDNKNLKPCPFNNIQATMARAFRLRRLFKPYWKDYNPLMSRDDTEELKTDREKFLELRKKVERNPKAYQRMLKKRARDDFKDHKPSADFWEVFYKKDTFKFCPDDDDDPELSLRFLTFCKIVFSHSALDCDLGRPSGSLRPLFLRRYSSLMQRFTQPIYYRRAYALNPDSGCQTEEELRFLDEKLLLLQETSVFWKASLKLILQPTSIRLLQDDTDFDKDSDCDDHGEGSKSERSAASEKEKEEDDKSIPDEEIEKFCQQHVTIIEDVEGQDVDDNTLDERTYVSHRDEDSIRQRNVSCFRQVCEACFVDDHLNPESRMDLRKDIATLAFLCNLQQPRHVAVMRRTGQDLADATRRFQEIDHFIAKKIVFNLHFFGYMCTLLYSTECDHLTEYFRDENGGSLFWSQFCFSFSYWFLLALYHQILHDEEITREKRQLNKRNREHSSSSTTTRKFFPVLSYIWDISYSVGAKPTDEYAGVISERILDKFHLQKLGGLFSQFFVVIFQAQLETEVFSSTTYLTNAHFHEAVTFAALPCIFSPPTAEYCSSVLRDIFDAETRSQFETEEVRELILCSLGPSCTTVRSIEEVVVLLDSIFAQTPDFFAQTTKLPSGFWDSFRMESSNEENEDEETEEEEEEKYSVDDDEFKDPALDGVKNIEQLYLDYVSKQRQSSKSLLPSPSDPLDRFLDIFATIGERLSDTEHNRNDKHTEDTLSVYFYPITLLIYSREADVHEIMRVVRNERILKLVTEDLPKMICSAEGLREWCQLLYWFVEQIKRVLHIDSDLQRVIDEQVCGKEVRACMVDKVDYCSSLDDSSCANWWATAFGTLGMFQRSGTLRVEFSTLQFCRCCKFVHTIAQDDGSNRAWQDFSLKMVEAVEAIDAPPDPFLSSRRLEDEYDRDKFFKERRREFKKRM